MKIAHYLLSVALALFSFAGLAQGQVISQNFTALTRSGTALIGVSGTDGSIKRSTDDGATFSTVFTPTGGSVLQNVSASGSTVIAVGTSGYIVRSTDAGATWTALDTTAAPASLGSLQDVASSNGTLWVAVGKSATNKVSVAYSTNAGAAWTAGTIGTANGDLRGVAYDASATRWAAVGNDGFGTAALYTSTNGQTWTAVTLPSPSTSALALRDVATDGAGNLVAVGDSGTILTSANAGTSYSIEANSGLVSQNLNAVVFSSTSSSFTIGGEELVVISYTVAGGSSVTQQPVPSGGSINSLALSSTGTVLTAGSLQGFQTITFANPGDQLMTASPLTLSATASSGLTVSFSVVGGTGTASISGNQITFLTAGTLTIRAAQAGNGSYLAAAPVDQTITVSKATATVNLSGLSATYDGSAKSATVSTTPNGLTVAVTYDGNSTAPTNAGTYAVAATVNSTTYSGSASGSLVIAKAAQTITFAGPGTQALGAAPITLSATTSSNLPVSFSLVSGPATLNQNTLTLTGTGTVVVTASQAGDANYNAATDVTRSFSVTAATATVTLGSLSATYDGSPKSATATTSPVGLSVAFTYDGSATAPTVPGTYAVVATITDPAYAGSATGTLTIDKASQTISFSAPTATAYTPEPIALDGTASSGLSVSYTVVSGPGTISGSTLTLTGPGTLVVRVSQAGNALYNAAPDVTVTVEVLAGFDGWRAEKFNLDELANPAISGPNGSATNDGFTNLVKYALGLDPHVPASSAVTAVTTTSTDWVFSYVRPSSTIDITYEVEVSQDMTTWTSVGVAHVQAAVNGANETWTASYPLASAPRLFFRLKISRNVAP